MKNFFWGGGVLLDFWGHLIQAFLFLHYFYILSTLNYLDLGTYVCEYR